jgi:mannose-6-phosphate isomerase-like protein (cupin superfamily)
MSGVVSIDELAEVLTEVYQHFEIGQVNDHAAYLLRFKGDNVWHRHAEDEIYIVLEGEVKIDYRNQPPDVLKRHDTLVVRAYTTHQASSEAGALVLMFKPKEVFAASDVERE